MQITMTDEELNSMALGIFVDFCRKPSWNRRTEFLIDTVYFKAEEYARALLNDKKIKDTIILPLNYIAKDVLKWVSGEEKVPSEWLLCWCNKWYHWYKDDIDKVMSPDALALQAVRAEAKRHLDELRYSEKSVFHEFHFLRYRMPSELNKFLNDFMLLRNRRHEAIDRFHVQQLLAYGFVCGVRAERKRRRENKH